MESNVQGSSIKRKSTKKVALGTNGSAKVRTTRSKTNQACASCQKRKTRCEVLNVSHEGPLRCHRCNILDISCSFENSISDSTGQSTSPPVVSSNAPTKDASPEAQSSSIASTAVQKPTGMETPGDVFCSPPNKAWGIYHRGSSRDFEWLSTPMFAIQKAMFHDHIGIDTPKSYPSHSLNAILGPGNIESLLNM